MLVSSLVLFATAVQSVAVAQNKPSQDVHDNLVRKPNMMPAVHPDQRLDDLQALVPKKDGQLYYADTPGKQSSLRTHKFLQMDAAYHQPTVMLEHSQYIKHVQCNHDGSINVEFNNKKAFDTAQENWKGKFILGTYSASCNFRPTKRSFYLSRTVDSEASENGGTINLKGRPLSTKEGLPSASMQWGTHYASAGYGDLIATRSIFGDNHTKSFDGNIDISITPPASKEVPTRFGQGFPLFSLDQFGEDFRAYCIDCGLTGKMDVKGKAVYNVDDGLEYAEVSVTGDDIVGQFNLGVIGYEYVFKSFPITLATLSLDPIIALDEIIDVGPMVSLSASTTVTLHHNGTLYAGLNTTFPHLDGTLVWTNLNSSHANAANPQVSPKVSASGSVGASISFGPSFSIDFGLSMPVINFNETIGISDTPAIAFDATYDKVGCEGGIDASISIKDSVAANIFNAATIPLYTWTGPTLYDHCFKGGDIGPGNGPKPPSNGTNMTTAMLSQRDNMMPSQLSY